MNNTRETFRVLRYNERLVRGLMRRGVPQSEILAAIIRKRETHYARAHRAIAREDARAMQVLTVEDYAERPTMVLPVLTRGEQAPCDN